MTSRLVIMSIAASVVAAACSSGGTSIAPAGAPSSAEPVNLTIVAGASLKGALEAAAGAYEASNPGVTIALSTDSSAALATQIEQGAPADVFLSADTKNPQRLLEAGLADGDAVVFAGNELTIIVPTGNPASIAAAADLARDGIRIVAAGDEVPITGYATQLLDNLAGESGYPSDFAAAYAANVVSKEDNVRAVVAKIELGEGDAGIVYVTDARASTRVEAIALPGSANVPASYAGIVVKASAHAPAGHAFLDWLVGEEGQAILSGFGFLPPAS